MNRNRRRNVYHSSRVANTEGLQGSVDGVMCAAASGHCGKPASADERQWQKKGHPIGASVQTRWREVGEDGRHNDQTPGRAPDPYQTSCPIAPYARRIRR